MVAVLAAVRVVTVAPVVVSDMAAVAEVEFEARVGVEVEAEAGGTCQYRIPLDEAVQIGVFQCGDDEGMELLGTGDLVGSAVFSAR